MTHITLKMLQDAGACHDQVVLFRKHFGRSVDVTRERCVEFADVFDWDWAARRLLSAPALAAYDAARAPALAAYHAARAPALAAYHAARATAFYDAWTLDHLETVENAK